MQIKVFNGAYFIILNKHIKLLGYVVLEISCLVRIERSFDFFAWGIKSGLMMLEILYVIFYIHDKSVV